MESAGELELDLRSIVEWGDRWLVIFNDTKTKLLSFKCHRDPLVVPVETNGIELPEDTSFRLLGLTFTQSMDWKPYTVHCQGCFKESRLPFRAQRFLSPESILYLYKYHSAIYGVSHILVGAPRSHRLDLLDRVQKLVVSLVCSGLSSDF